MFLPVSQGVFTWSVYTGYLMGSYFDFSQYFETGCKTYFFSPYIWHLLTYIHKYNVIHRL